MLAGLIFATHDAIDRPGTLAATLPFSGMTLIEFQARLLIEAGAGQIIVVVARLTPELLGAVSRIGRRSVAVDTVRNASEAAEKLHPLSRVLMLADGLITTGAIVAQLAGEGGEALMVMEASEAPAGFERVGGNAAWAGVARINPRRLTEVAAMPRDYDMQSALVRVADQAKAQHLLLPRDAIASGHGIEQRAAAIATRGRAILATMVADRPSWFERYLVAPLARVALPTLIDRAVPTVALSGAAGVATAFGILLLTRGWPTPGLVLLLLATAALSLGATLARLRDELRAERGQSWGIAGVAAVGALLLGQYSDALTATGSGVLLAVGLIVLAALGERAALPRLRQRWWGSPAGYLLVLLPFAAAGAPLLGLGCAAGYAAASVAAAIEALRRQP